MTPRTVWPVSYTHLLSKGSKEKVQLILAMSRAAKLYLLDEPIGGVDPAAREMCIRDRHCTDEPHLLFFHPQNLCFLLNF